MADVLTIEDGELTKCNCHATKVVIPEGVRRIGYRAFNSCYALKTVEIPSTMKNLGVEPFEYSGRLEEITYHGTMAEWTFGLAGFNNLSEAIPVHCIDGDAKPFDKSAKSITIPEGVSKIEFKLFSGCAFLESIVIPESVSAIRTWAFSSCSSLKSIVLNSNLKKIENDAFTHCDALEDITYKGTIAQWESVEGKNGLMDFVPAKCVHCSDGDWEKPLILIENGKVIECLDKSITSAKIPEGVTKIGYSAFAKCKALVSVELPESLRELCWRAFENCKALESIIIPKGVTKIEHSVFEHCTSLKSVELGGSVLEIESGVFEECTSLEKVVLHEGVTELPNDTFNKCSSLKTVVFPQSLTKINHRVFRGCKALESVSFGDNVKEIDGEYAFDKCTSLRSIEIGANVTKISAKAFDGCTAVESVVSASPLYPFNEKTRKLYDATGSSKKAILTLSKEIAKKEKIAQVQNASANAIIMTMLEERKQILTANAIHEDKATYLSIKSGEASGIEILLPDSKVSKWMKTLPALLDLAANGEDTLSLLKYASENDLENASRKYMTVSKTGEVKMKRFGEPVYLVFPEGTTKISDVLLWQYDNVKSIVLPSSLKEIGACAIKHCKSLEEIIFTGTYSQWKEVKKDLGWHDSIKTHNVKCADGEYHV